MKNPTTKKHLFWKLSFLLACASIATHQCAAGPPGPAPAQPAEAPRMGVSKADRVNIRAKASSEAEIIGQLKKGDKVTVLEIKKTTPPRGQPAGGATEWARIVLPESVKVYIFKNLVADGTVKANEANVRAGPSLDHAAVGRLKKGTRVEIVETKGNWLGIKPTPELHGWVAAQFLELSKIEPTAEPIAPEPTIVERPVTEAPRLPEPAIPIPPQVHIREGVIRTGTLLPADAEAPEGATHQLYVEGKESRDFALCYIKWVEPSIKPARFESKLVRIRGREIWERGKRIPLMEVSAIERVW